MARKLEIWREPVDEIIREFEAPAEPLVTIHQCRPMSGIGKVKKRYRNGGVSAVGTTRGVMTVGKEN